MKPHPTTLRHILITGASSGLGAALAVHYAIPGVRLSLLGRNAERLAQVAGICAQRGAALQTDCLDVTDAEAMQAWITATDRAVPLDLVIANAGISAGTARGVPEPAAQVRAVMATNVDGMLNTVLPVIAPMVARGRGQIALMASLAAFRGMPGAAAYSASKAAVKVYGEALRRDLAPNGVRVNVICPGFVDTPLTRANRFQMPLLMQAPQAAATIAAALANNKGRIAFPLPMAFAAWLLSALPDAAASWLTARAPRKV
jgi:short-subunit dehydrogenase